MIDATPKMRMHANDANKIIYKDLSYQLTGLFFRIQNELGRFCKELHYAKALEELLIQSKINYQREVNLSKIGKTNFNDRLDFIIENQIIIDLKAKPFITKEDYFQMMRYLEFSNLKLGMIVNFRNKYLKPKRIINSKIRDIRMN